jgi:hypothetical protein
VRAGVVKALVPRSQAWASDGAWTGRWLWPALVPAKIGGIFLCVC